MAHKSLALKLDNRKINNQLKNQQKKLHKKENFVFDLVPPPNGTIIEENEDEEAAENGQVFEQAEMKMIKISGDDQIKDENQNYIYKKRRNNSKNQNESREENIVDNRVDKVYTIGCFDIFHEGHVKLIERMRECGKKVIIGVHDSRSIYKLKNRVPVDSTEKRMLNVKKYADEVFCVAGCDPSNFMTCILNLDDKKQETAMYVRGDDMPDFPSRHVVENLMPIKFLPYTEGVSSSLLRKEKFSHIAPNDENYLEENN
jgi:cytidyltransferase-like protein